MLKKIKYLFLFFIFVSSLQWVCAKPLTDIANGSQRYTYDVYYKKLSVGQMVREFEHKEGHTLAKTKADLSLFFYRLAGEQISDIYWDDASKQFLSQHFVRKDRSSKKNNAEVNFLDSGHRTKLIRSGKTYQFSNKENKIVDFHAIGMQMSEGIKAGQTHFDFYMQTTEKVKHYFFEVKGEEVIDTKLGKLNTFRLEQTRKKNRKLIIWFAPDINYQMVKFYYKFNLLDLRGNISKYEM